MCAEVGWWRADGAVAVLIGRTIYKAGLRPAENSAEKPESDSWGPNRSKIWSEQVRPRKSILADSAAFRSAAEVRSGRPNLFLTTFSDAVKPAVSETVSNFSRRPFLRSQSSFCACQIAISLLWPPASLRHQAGPGPFYFSWLALGTLFFCSRALPAHRSGFVFFFLWPKRRLLFFFLPQQSNCEGPPI